MIKTLLGSSYLEKTMDLKDMNFSFNFSFKIRRYGR